MNNKETMENQVDEIKSRLDIIDVMSGYIRLIQAGANFKALCPFHNEKTPSLMISREKQIWKCFGCGKGGDMFTFIMEIEGVEFKEALRILAGKAGVILKYQDIKIASKRNKILDCLESASRFFHQALLHPRIGEIARKYVNQREIKEETLEEFRLGYAPDSWDMLYKALRKKGFYEKEIEAAGLIIKRDQSSGYYDRFRNRLMFPIKDINENVIGFSGRILSPDEKSAKYINSPQTAVFDKSRIMYALDKAKSEIRKNDLAIVVEGQMDLISSHQAGVKNVIATSGTALTNEHIKIIKRYTNNLALSFDNDEAGKNAAKKAAILALQSEMNTKIIVISNGKDPDECIKNNVEIWRKAIKDALPFMEYSFKETISKLDITNAQDKKLAAKILLPLIANISDKVEQNHYIQKLANYLNLQEAILREVLASRIKKEIYTRETSFKKNEKLPSLKKDKSLEIAERIIAFSLIYPQNLEYLKSYLPPDFIHSENLKNLYKIILIYYTKLREKVSQLEDIKFDIGLFNKFNESQNLKRYIDEICLKAEKEIAEARENNEIISSIKIEIEIKEGVSNLGKEHYKEKIRELQIKIQKAEEEKDNEALKYLIKEADEMVKKIKN